MRKVRGISGRFFRALAEANVNIRAIAQGSSERSISAVIAEKKTAEAVAFAHTAFFNSKQRLELIVIGVGGVGGELLKQIHHQREAICDRHGVDIKVVGLANSKRFYSNPLGISLENYEDTLSNEGTVGEFSVEALRELIKQGHLINPVIVDCTSNEKIALSYTQFMQEGAHVVTPSKKANTCSYAYYKALRETAKVNHRKFLYEANVGAGLPVINTLQNELAAGDSLIEFSGIMSGTLSYIFGLVEDGYTLSEATLNAYEKGFTEPNPRDDLEGMDVARKVLILARECGYELELSDIDVEAAVEAKFLEGANAQEVLANLKACDDAFQEKVQKAKAQDKVLRYVATISKSGKCSCGVKAVDASDPLYKVRGGENALAFTTEYYQPIPLVIRGYGAGTSVTAAGVLADILRLQRWTRED